MIIYLRQSIPWICNIYKILKNKKKYIFGDNDNSKLDRSLPACKHYYQQNNANIYQSATINKQDLKPISKADTTDSKPELDSSFTKGSWSSFGIVEQ